eukprot:scaffold174224_cov29-Tisochrysis_lutea.AAC.8
MIGFGGANEAGAGGFLIYRVNDDRLDQPFDDWTALPPDSEPDASCSPVGPASKSSLANLLLASDTRPLERGVASVANSLAPASKHLSLGARVLHLRRDRLSDLVGANPFALSHALRASRCLPIVHAATPYACEISASAGARRAAVVSASNASSYRLSEANAWLKPNCGTAESGSRVTATWKARKASEARFAASKLCPRSRFTATLCGASFAAKTRASTDDACSLISCAAASSV